MGNDRVLLIGGGGREHALAWKLSQSPRIARILVTPGNAGTGLVPKSLNIELNVKDHKAVVNYCLQNKVDLVVVGPEDPLANGLADDLTAANIKCFGPSKAAAQIEASKEFSKDFMNKHNIPTAQWKSFQDAKLAQDYIQMATFDALVVKASGLAAGKGVVVASNKEEAVIAAKEMLTDKKFGEAGNTIVVEELLKGVEISVLAFTDGSSVCVMPPAQDHKRVFDGDQGPNTGGMGAYCPCPLVLQSVLEEIKKEVLQKTVDGMKADGIPYSGVLYAGLMLTESGPKVLEFNCRFGDPETESILPLMSSDIYPTLLACTNGTLSTACPVWKEETSAVGIVIVSGGYPDAYPKGKIIKGLDSIAENSELIVFHAGTAKQGDNIVTAGGRVLVVVSLKSELKSAADTSLEMVNKIHFEGAFFRKDIAHKALRTLDSAKRNLLTYKSSGVDIVAGDELVNQIKECVASTRRTGVASSIGGFGGVFDLKGSGYDEPLLVSGTDGVGTKLKIAHSCNIHETVGIDLVAMCVNDILCQGAESLFFLDYFGCGQLDVAVAQKVVSGVAEGCRQANCALIGGETAEMPGMYPKGEYDLAGFAVGAVERTKVLPDLDSITEGDILIGLPSSGLHSNGFSLVRKLIEREELKYTDPAPFDSSKTVGQALLTPTRIYVRQLLPSLQKGLVKAAAHITGGGILENIPRVLPKNLAAELDAKAWNLPPIYKWIANSGNVSAEEMLRSFNCGLGMVLVVCPTKVNEVTKLLQESGEEPKTVGKLKKLTEGSKPVEVNNFKVSQIQISKKIRKRIGILISGSGTNLQSLIDYTQDPIKSSSAEIVLVISNVATAAGLKRAEKAGIPTKVISHKGFKSRVEFDMAVHQTLKEADVQIICLAGFMRILSEDFVKLWEGSLINVHPSLLPSFRGIHAHRQALAAGVRVTGCTVHFVDADVDTGAIIKQEAVQILVGDTEETLSERVKLAEHQIYPQALELLARGKVERGVNGKAIFIP